MKDGQWIPISKCFLNELPKDRAYTKLEAAYSLQFDYDKENTVTILGYSKLWGWSRKKVSSFLEQMGIDIIYPENTENIKNKKGHIRVHKRNIKGPYKEHKRLIDNKDLKKEKNIKGPYKGHKGDIKDSTTIDTKKSNTKNNIIYTSEFLRFYEAYPKHKNKKKAFEAWETIKKNGNFLEIVLKAIEQQKQSEQWQNEKYIPHPTTWLNGNRWEDEVKTEKAFDEI